jgi:hypothetical protein
MPGRRFLTGGGDRRHERRIAPNRWSRRRRTTPNINISRIVGNRKKSAIPALITDRPMGVTGDAAPRAGLPV